MAGDRGKARPEPAWARAADVASLEQAPPPSSWEEAVDRTQAIERLHRYCWSYDERDRESLRDCFLEDAVWEGLVMDETTVGPFNGREEILDWMTGFWPYQRDQRRHMVLNVIIGKHVDDLIEVSAYLLLLGTEDASTEMEVSGMYRLDMVRDGRNTWRIGHLRAGFDAPFWKGEVDDMSDRVRGIFGIRPENH